MNVIYVPFNVTAESKKRAESNVMGTGMFPCANGKFKSQKFYNMFHEMCESLIREIEIDYFSKFDKSKPMKGYIRSVCIQPVQKHVYGGLKILVHIDGTAVKILGFHEASLSTKVKYGTDEFLSKIAGALQWKINDKVDENFRKYATVVKDKRDITYKLRYKWKEQS